MVSDVFSYLNEVLHFWQGYQKMRWCPSQYIISEGTWWWFVPLLKMLAVITWWRWCLLSVSIARVLYSSCLMCVSWDNNLRVYKYPLIYHNFTTNCSTSIDDTCLKQLLLCWFPTGNFLFWSFLIYSYWLEFEHKEKSPLLLYLLVCLFVHLFMLVPAHEPLCYSMGYNPLQWWFVSLFSVPRFDL